MSPHRLPLVRSCFLPICFCLTLVSSLPGQVAPVPNIGTTASCPNTPNGAQPYRVNNLTSGNLRKVVINAPGAVCNDGTPAVIYVRPARAGAIEPDGVPASSRWLIHFNGGSSCSDYEECGTRWCGIGQWEGTLMTSKWEGDFKNADGLLGTNPLNRLGDRNIVQMKYCSSDTWVGRKSNVVLTSESDPSVQYSLHFQGATIVSAVFDALERGVQGMPRLGTASEVLLSGDSAGATGARAHADRLSARLKLLNPNMRVRAQFEATFNPDTNGKQGFPAGDPRDPPYANKTATYNRVDVGLRNALLDDSCLAAHPSAPYLCSDDSYVAMNHLTTPFFQIQDIQDRLMINGMQSAGVTATPGQITQGLYDQLGALSSIRTTALERASLTANPAAVSRNCGLHVGWADDDSFLGKRMRSAPGAPEYSYFDLLWNWMNGTAPSTGLMVPRPPLTPDPPPTDPICSARAPNAAGFPSLVVISSASYNIGSPVGAESIVAAFGSNLASSTQTATTLAWPTTLGAVSVAVRDSRNVSRLAPLYYVSPTQLLFLIPAGTADGTAEVAVNGQRQSIEIASPSPALYAANQRGDGVAAGSYLRIRPGGARSEGRLFDPATLEPNPIPAEAGDQIYLILFGTGLRGAPATATVGDVSVPVAGPVPQGQYLGLDQINLGPLPARVGRGLKEVIIRQGQAVSNTVTVTIR